MAKFRKAFAGVPAGEIYPVEYAKGEECPPELLDAAIELGAVRAPKPAPTDPASPDTDPAEEEDDGEVDAEAEDAGGDDVVLEDGTDAA